MIEDDYIMRMIQALFDAVNRIINRIDKEDISGSKQIIDETYSLLGANKEFFNQSDSKTILAHFSEDEPTVKMNKVNALAQLLFQDYQIENCVDKKEKIKSNIIDLIDHYNSNSLDYSIELSRIQNFLK